MNKVCIRSICYHVVHETSMRTELDYAYLAPSTLLTDNQGSRLALATSGGSTVQGPILHPFFFSGFVPPGSLAAVLRAADPVVTSTPEGLRFESFSVCCGVYARLDFDKRSLDVYHSVSGVTNVDVNPPLRQALAGLRGHEPLHLNVGNDELRITTTAGTVVEERVPLPSRWLKGFAETQMLSTGMSLRHALDGAEVRQFVQALPPSSSTKTVMWATRATRGLRLASRPSAGAVCAGGPERLRMLEPLLQHATALRAYGPDADAASLPMASAWALELAGGRLTIVLSPEKARGLSGEGAVLHTLTSAEVSDDADRVSAMLAFDPRIDVAALASDTALTTERVLGALGLLASSGQVGYDLAVGAYFHRPLPVRADALEALHPRLADAQKLVDAQAVNFRSPGEFQVTSGPHVYTVRLNDEPDPSSDRCTCPWYAKHRGTRGPCKHVLAVRIAAERGTQ
jgi:hypothetical protein